MGITSKTSYKKEMKKIGLITTYSIDNYGTKLQAYAMLEILKDLNGGDNVTIIDYYPKYDIRPNAVLGKIINKICNIKKKSITNRTIENELKTRHKAINSIDQFLDRTEAIKGFHNLKHYGRIFDTYVCGSDQIWAESNLISDFYCFQFVSDEKNKIAYAPSFGTDKLSVKAKNQYKKLISRINYVSVREKSGISIINTILPNKKVQQVVDPTILAGKQFWDETIKCNKSNLDISGEYIFCYLLGNDTGHREFIRKISIKTGAKIVILPHMKKYNQADEINEALKLYDVSPFEFISLVKNAKYVCTDSFHGTVFSLIFEKEFFVFERFKKTDSSSTNTRIHSLLEISKTTDRLVCGEENIEDLLKSTIDYKTTTKLINAERSISKKYLEKALHEEKE